MAAACAPCVFGAAATNLLTFPTSVATAHVEVATILNIVSGVVATSYSTTTILPSSTPGQSPVYTITYTDPAPLVWTTLGAVLTYPTTYVDYSAFQGAAVSTSTACANTLTPTALSIPAGVPTASLIYPFASSNALPDGLLGYLDGQPGFLAQLSGYRLESCGPINGLPSPTASSVLVAITTSSPVGTTTVTQSSPPPPTTFTSTSFTALTSSVLSPVSATSSMYLSIAPPSGKTYIASGTSTGTVPAQALTQATTTGANGKVTTTTGIHFSSLLSIISSSSLASLRSSQGVYTNVTSVATSTYGSLITPSKSASATAQYTGAAAPQTIPVVKSLWTGMAAFFGLVMAL